MIASIQDRRYGNVQPGEADIFNRHGDRIGRVVKRTHRYDSYWKALDAGGKTLGSYPNRRAAAWMVTATWADGAT